jgi:uncharacterized membrane protein YhaH (DUF805 family)
MAVFETLKLSVKRAFDYKSRATPKEFWWFLFVFFGWIVLAVIVDESVFMGGTKYLALYNIVSILWTLVYIGGLVCLLSLTVRRLHDSDMSGFWVLLIFVPLGPFILLFLMFRESTPHENRFGHISDEDEWALFD